MTESICNHETSSCICTYTYSSLPDLETCKKVSFTSWCKEQGFTIEVMLAEEAVRDVSYL